MFLTTDYLGSEVILSISHTQIKLSIASFHNYRRSQWSSGSVSDCGMRGPRFHRSKSDWNSEGTEEDSEGLVHAAKSGVHWSRSVDTWRSVCFYQMNRVNYNIDCSGFAVTMMTASWRLLDRIAILRTRRCGLLSQTELRGLSLGRSVWHTSEPYKNGWTDRDVVSAEGSDGPSNHVLDRVQIIYGKRQIWKGRLIVGPKV